MVGMAAIGSLLALVAIGLITPGPNNLTALIHSGLHGFRSNFPLIFGMAVGFITLQFVVLILVDFINQNNTISIILHWIGVSFILIIALAIGRLRPHKFERQDMPRLGFKTGFSMQWINGKEWGFVTIYMATLLDDFGGGLEGGILIIGIVSTVCVMAILAWSYFGANLERYMTDPKIAPKLFPILGFILGGLGIIIGLNGVNQIFQKTKNE